PAPSASVPVSRAPVRLPTRLPKAAGPVDGETFAANGRQADALLRTALDGDLPALYVTSFRDGGRRAADQYADFLDQLGRRDGARARAFHRAVLDLTPTDLRRALFGEGRLPANSAPAPGDHHDHILPHPDGDPMAGVQPLVYWPGWTWENGQWRRLRPGEARENIQPLHQLTDTDPRPNLLKTTAAETPDSRPTSHADEGRDLAREPDQRESGNRPADSVPKVGPDTPADTDEEELVRRGRHFMKPAIAELYDDLHAHAKSDTPLAPTKVDALHRRTQDLFPGDAKGAEPYHRHIEYLRDGEGITDHELDYLGSVGSEVQRVQREIYALAMAGAIGRGRGRKGRPGHPSRKASQDGNRKRSASDDDIALPSKSVTVNPYTVDEFRALPQSGTLDPKRIRTMQNSVNDEFRDGRRLVDTIKELKSGETKTIHIDPIRIGEIDGQVFTLDHRRVVAHRLAGIPIKYRKVTPAEIKRAQKGWKNRKKGKMTTNDNGMSIRIIKRQ
ncbi:hypothetical protein KDL45_12535, partial [bacterium]|nr:hypothetical protein [bacterium]